MSLDPSIRTRCAAVLVLFGALGGLGLSAWLSYVTFRRNFWCDGSGCMGGDASPLLACDQALDSPWSAFLGVPWSLWSAAHAVAVVVLAVALLRARGPLARSAPAVLLALGAVAVAVSTVLGVHAWTHFDHLCRLCVGLYMYSALVLGGAVVMRGGPQRRDHLDLDDCIAAARSFALVLALLAAQTLVYRVAARHAECPGLAPELPAAALVRAVAAPHTALLVFVDPSCELCRELHHMMQQPRLRGLLAGVELRVFLVPRAVCDERSMPAHEFVDAAGDELSNDGARNHDACLAARVLYCMEARERGAGVLALDAVFRLQETRAGQPYFSFDALVGALREAGLLGGDVSALRGCVDGDAVAGDIAGAQAYLRDWVQAHRGKLGLPQVFVVPIAGGRLDLRAVEQARDAEKLRFILQSTSAEP